MKMFKNLEKIKVNVRLVKCGVYKYVSGGTHVQPPQDIDVVNAPYSCSTSLVLPLAENFNLALQDSYPLPRAKYMKTTKGLEVSVSLKEGYEDSFLFHANKKSVEFLQKEEGKDGAPATVTVEKSKTFMHFKNRVRFELKSALKGEQKAYYLMVERHLTDDDILDILQGAVITLHQYYLEEAVKFPEEEEELEVDDPNLGYIQNKLGEVKLSALAMILLKDKFEEIRVSKRASK